MSPDAYSFGPFRLDPADRRLSRDGVPLEVSARYLDALILLVREDGRLVTKDRFMDEVWRGIPVTDEALTQCIRSLRKALDDDASNPRVIETVPRHGYRLMLPVAEADGGPATPAPPGPTSSDGVIGEIVVAGLGGGGAGIVAALGYLALGLVAPRIGTASTLLVLLSTNLLLGFVGGGAIGAGVALVGRRIPGLTGAALGGLIGGAVVGAAGRMVGTDLFTLFFGQAPTQVTGALEGAILGLAVGAAVGAARRWQARPGGALGAMGVAAGLVAGTLIALANGRLMVGSLVDLAASFPDNKLAVAPLGPKALAAATVAEAVLFISGVVGALLALRRMRS